MKRFYWVAMLVLVLPLVFGACSKVTEYEVAVKENNFNGNVVDQIYSQGLRPAFFVSYHKFPLREISYPEGDQESDRLSALTADQLEIMIEAGFRYQIQAEHAYKIYTTIGNTRAVKQFVYNAYREAVRDAVAEIPATRILSRNVEGIDNRIESLLSETTNPRGIIITEFFLRHIEPPTRLKEAIENKLAREQEVETSRYQTQVVVEQANQKREEAAGIRDAQAIIAESLEGARGQRYLYWRYLEVLGMIGEGENNIVIAPTEGGMPIFLNSN